MLSWVQKKPGLVLHSPYQLRFIRGVEGPGGLESQPPTVKLNCSQTSSEVWFTQRVLNNSPAVWNCVTEIVLLHKLNFSPKCDLQKGCRAENPVSMTICPIPVPGEAWGESVKSHRCHVYSATNVIYPSRSPTFAGDKYSAHMQGRFTDLSGPKHSLSLFLCQAWGLKEHHRTRKTLEHLGASVG